MRNLASNHFKLCEIWPRTISNYVRFGKFCGYLCVFKGIGGAGPIAGIRGVGGHGGPVWAISGLPPVELYIWDRIG
jgi:hypothetical protein